MVTARDVAVLTPWYPSHDLPYRGAFVQAMVEATAPGCDSVTVYFPDAWGARVSAAQDVQIQQAQAELLRHAARTGTTAAGAGLTYLPVPMPRGLPFAENARRLADGLRDALGGKPLDAPIVHAHVGIPGGWAALRNARPDARIFVTEHATFLDRILAEPDCRAMYDELLQRSSGFFAVGSVLRDQLVEMFPHHADRISIVPNPISFDLPRPEPVTELRRWLYIGSLIPRKGVDWVLEGFAKCHAADPALTLSIVGDGELRAKLGERADELGVADAVTFSKGVTPDEALRLMREHDLLVHNSRYETFGMTIVEAVAAGMPVLVTRCGGPEESLAGIEEAAGQMIDIDESDKPIVEGYQELRSRFPAGVDLARARQVLKDRYGYEAVAAAHHRAWFGDGE